MKKSCDRKNKGKCLSHWYKQVTVTNKQVESRGNDKQKEVQLLTSEETSNRVIKFSHFLSLTLLWSSYKDIKMIMGVHFPFYLIL